ncbi:MAG TPA: transposase, partial [Thermomicrobiales bacterium]|nr:transposase [Thermomicrobiales bacterium]
GRYARWLCRAIQAQGWHPFLRSNPGGRVRPAGWGGFVPLRALAPAAGAAWQGRVTCFATPDCQLGCTLLARWDAGHADPWLLLTDLAPAQAEAAWYGLRSWVEQGFKDLKRGGWPWQRTRMAAPDRVARRWLALAVATLWAVSVGGAAEAALPASGFDALPETHVARRRGRHRPPARLLSCFRRGLLHILVALLGAGPLPLGRFLPEPWPEAPAPGGAAGHPAASTA